MEWKHCGCGPDGYFRTPRSWWMPILFGSRRLYRCARCGTTLFLKPREVPLAAHLSTHPPGHPHA